MAITTTWKVLDMKHNPNDGGISYETNNITRQKSYNEYDE